MTTHETPFGISILADCLDYMKTMTDKSVDLVITSPPYDNLREYGEGKGYTFTFDSFAMIAQQIQRVLKDGGVCVWVVNDATINGSETLTSFKQAIYFVDQLGMKLHDTMIYEKDAVSFPDKNRYQSQFEYMFILSNGSPKTFTPIKIKTAYPIVDGKTMADRGKDGVVKKKIIMCEDRERVKGNVWRMQVGYMKSSKDPKAFEHPAIFPEQLANDHILSWSNPNDTILDPFAGSFTTAIACIRTGRKYICVEKEPKYFEIGVKRIERELDQLDFLRDKEI